MKRDSWIRILALFEEALELEPGCRARWLEDSDANKAERAAVARMLEEDAKEEAFLDQRPQISLTELDLAAPGLEFGTTVGDFEVHGVLGSGGMSTVYLAQQRAPRREVALKTLRPGTLTERGLQRFAMEAEILGRLHHPGIAEVFESGIHRGPDTSLPYIAMELVAGSRDVLRYAHGLDLEGRLDLFLETCSAVQYAHQRGVIHRDLKPSNLLVDEHGQVKVIDFGLARVEDERVSRLAGGPTQSGQAAGTLLYMSPEQRSGQRDAVDLRSDVYALGVILYELLAGEHPYGAENKSLLELTRALEEREPRPLSAVAPHLGQEMAWITGRALERNPAARYASVSELAADVERFLRHEPVLAGPPSGLYRLRKLVRRHRAAVAVGSALLGVGLTGLLATLWQRGVAQRRLLERNAELEVASQTGAFVTRALLGSGAAHTGSAQPTLRDFADRMAQDLADAPVEHSALELQLQATLGDVYAILGEQEQASDHLQRALRLSETLHGADHQRTLTLRNQTNAALLCLSLDASVAERIEETLDDVRAALGPGHRETGIAAYHAACFALEANDLERANVLLDRAARILEASVYPEWAENVRTMRMRVAARAGDLERLAAFEIPEREPVDERGESDTARLLDAWSEVAALLTRGRYNGNLERAERILERLMAALGSAHPEVLAVRAQLGHEYARAGRPAIALPHVQAVDRACEALRGQETLQIAAAMVHVGAAYLKLSEVEPAIEILEAALRASLRQGADHTFAYHQAQLCQGMAHFLLGEPDLAEAYYSDALYGAEEDLGPDHFLVFLIRNNMALLRGSSGDVRGALAILEPAAARCAEVLGDDDAHQTLMLRFNLAAFLLEARDLERAATILRDVIARRERILGSHHGEVLDARQTLSQVLWLRGEREAAASLMGSVARERLEHMGPRYPQARISIQDYAGMLRELGRREEADEWSEHLEGAAPLPQGLLRAAAASQRR